MLLIEPLGIAWRPVPKCGTSSVFKLIYDNLYDDDISKLKIPGWKDTRDLRATLKNNFKCDNLRAVTDEEHKKMLSSDIFVFALVRNPWARLVAGYLQAMRWFDPEMDSEQRDAIAYNQKRRLGLKNDEIYTLLNGDLSFENFVDFVVNVEPYETNDINNHWKPQFKMLRPNFFKYDFFGKIEEWDYTWELIKHNSKMHFTKTPNLNRHPKYNYKDFYTNTKLIDKVEKYYLRDLELFKDYVFDK